MRGRILILSLAPLLGMFALFDAAGLRMNTSASLPVGLYIVSPNGGFVEFCPDDRGLSAQRHYRARGVCSDGAAPLLKPVVAAAGDAVELSARGISVNGVLLPNTAPLSEDSKGRPLGAWPFGRYCVAPGAVWVASSHHPRSFDSRYFGPISTAAIRHRLRPFLTL